MDKFRGKLPKDELKKFAKEISKKLVASDYKHKRVDDPTAISEKQKAKVRKYVKDYFERAVEKYNAHEKQKADRVANDGSKLGSGTAVGAEPIDVVKNDEDSIMTDDEAKGDEDDTGSTPDSSLLKRKRDEEDALNSATVTPSEPASIKRLKGDGADENGTPSPPPPPPPPPEGESAEQQAAAEEAERLKLAEEEAALERENELNMRDFEREQGQPNGTAGQQEVPGHQV